MAQNTANKITGSAPKLQGKGCISYEVTKGGGGLELRVTNNTESGTFTTGVKLKTVIKCAAPAGTFTTAELKTAIGTDNNNDAGFLVAALTDLGVVAKPPEPSGSYRLVGFS